MDNVHYYSTDSAELSLIQAHYQEFAFQRHYHLDFHIGLITQGQQKFIHQGTRHHVGQGEIVIMPPDELHDGHSYLPKGYQVQVFTIQPQWLSDLADLKQNGQIISFNQLIISDPAVFLHLDNLHQSLRQKNVSQLAKDCLPFEGFSHLINRYGSFKPTTSTALGSQSITQLKDYLLANLDQAVRLEQLSELCQLSPTQFQRHFKQKMGITPYAWLTRLRMEQSIQLIKSGVCGTDVALQVGFYDQAHFSKAFKATYGVVPSRIN